MEEEKYLLWASDKDWHYNSPVFWGKGNSGYYSTLEDCEQYTLEEAMKYADKDTIPVKLSELMKHQKTVFENVNMILNEAMKANNWDSSNEEEVHDCSTCDRLEIESMTGVCPKFGVLNDVKEDCGFWTMKTIEKPICSKFGILQDMKVDCNYWASKEGN